MIPEIDTQLAAVCKSLADNVLPALDPANPLAVEQLRLSIATLAIVRSALPYLHAMQRRDLEEQVQLARRIGDALALASSHSGPAQVLRECAARAAAMLSDTSAGASQIETQVRMLKEGLVQAIDAARGSSIEADLSRLVLRAQVATNLRMRAWAKGMGFEPDPAAVPDLETLLAHQQQQ